MEQTAILRCLKGAIAMVIVGGCMASPAFAEGWSIDLSRRTGDMRKAELQRGPASQRPDQVDPATSREVDEQGRSFISRMASLVESGEGSQDIVILNTERGFVPHTLRLRAGSQYVIHVVNVNEKEKNVSFILDGFSEHHATYYGRVKTFRLEPRKDGIYSFLSPETAAEGRVIVFSPQESPRDGVIMRRPAQTEATTGEAQPKAQTRTPRVTSNNVAVITAQPRADQD
jgi:hypothetical protein